MYLDYSQIASGTAKQPTLRLQTLAGVELGVIPFVYDLKISVNYSDLSEIEFSVPYQVNGILNPMYGLLTSYKVIYTEELGVYLMTSPKKTGDGVSEIKTVTGYSLEQCFANKNLFLEEGTYNFWNPATPDDTVLGRLVELDPTWSVGYVAPRLIGCYRTFDEYDSDALSFAYGDAMEKYRCAFVFDVYKKTVNAYDAGEDTSMLPIYLSYQNLVESVEVSEIVDEFATKLHLYGSDSLTIRDVNPIGTDYIINLDYFISNGDLDVVPSGSTVTLAEKVKAWEASIAAQQTYYTGLAASRASLTAQKLTAQAALTELNGEMDSLTSQQSVTIQALALEITDAGIAYQEELLADINSQIAAKQAEIDAKQAEIDSLASDIEDAAASITAVVNELSLSAYFTENELELLTPYLIEADLEDETFVATDVDTSVSGTLSTLSGTVAISDSTITQVSLSDFGKTMYVVKGGTLVASSASLDAEIVRGTLEVKSDNSYVMTCYLGALTYSDHSFDSGLVTVSGTLSSLSSDISAVTENEITEYLGTTLQFSTSGASIYFTVGVSDYQQYSVAAELYDFGEEALDDYAWPVYEFTIDSANFLYHSTFEPFKDSLELGRGIWLELGSEGLVTPKIIGVELDFSDITKFELTFSNRYQRKNKVATWIEEIKSTSRSSRSFDASKYIYNRAADMTTSIDDFMSSQLNAAVNNIVNKTDQTVLINGSGINIGGTSNYQIRIVDNMIAMTDDNWQTAKLAIGLFATEETGTQWGVNAELLAGKLIIGNTLVLQNVTDDGYMSFMVDSTGVWLYNSRYVIQGSNGGLIIIDPDYGIVGGTSLLFDTNGTTVTPEFLDSAGDITFDADGMPENSNFYLDINTGDAYFRGHLLAQSGEIGGYTIENGYLHSGTSSSNYVALNGGTDVYSAYAIWAGATNPANAPFWVKKNGDFYAQNGTFAGTLVGVDGTFSGTLSAAYISGSLTADSDGGELIGCAIYVPSKTNYKFMVDANGNVSMLGNLTLASGSISFSNLDKSTQNAIDAAMTADDVDDAIDTAISNLDIPTVPDYIQTTWINSTSILSPYIYGGAFYATGRGRYSEPAFYIYDGCTVNSNTGKATLGTECGYLSYDDKGSGSQYEATSRVFLTSMDGIALKIQSGDNMSLEASGGIIYVQSNTSFTLGGKMIGSSGYMYGSSFPSSPSVGQIFFLQS